MDLLKDAAKNLNLYEVKAYVRKAQNGMYFIIEKLFGALMALY